MKAIRFKEGQISVIEKPIPDIGAEEALIKTVMVGVCNTDIELFNGYYGFEGIAGHEFVGIVEKSPKMPELVGKRVVGDINCGCGRCRWCLSGNKRHCQNRTVIGIVGRDGAFAEYLTVPIENIYIVDDSIDSQEAVFTEPLAAALEISQQVHITNQSRVLVLGDGKLGLLISLGLKQYNPHLVLCGRHPEKLQIAADQGVQTEKIDPQAASSHILHQLNGPFDIVVEVTGSPDGINLAMDLTRPEGIIIAKTTSHKNSAIDLAKIVVNELNIIGSRCGDFDLALSFLKNKWLDVRPLIEAKYPFSDFKKAFEHACTKGSKKVLIAF